jgi:hypothetical protein
MSTYRVHSFTVHVHPENARVHGNGQLWPAQVCRAVHTSGVVCYVMHYQPDLWLPTVFGKQTHWVVFNRQFHALAKDSVLETALREAEAKL